MPFLLIIAGGVAVGAALFGYRAGTGAAAGMSAAEDKVASGTELLLIAAGVGVIIYAHGRAQA
jgi:hypothetical protein